MRFHFSRGMLHLSAALGASLIACALPSTAAAQLLDSTTPLRPPQDVEEAEDAKIREFMRSGFSEYRKKNLEGARDAFVKAWETARRPAVAAALADVEMKLGRYRDAAEHWDYYLRTKPADRAEAAARLDECRVHVTVVRVELEPVGAELHVDDNRVPTGGSGGTIWLEPGAHTFSARSEGRASPTLRIDATAGQDVSIRLVVDSAPAAAPGSAGPPLAVASPQPLASVQRDVADTAGTGLPTHSAMRIKVAISGAVLTVAAAAVGTWFVVERSNTIDQRTALLNDLDQQYPDYAKTDSVCTNRPGRPPACFEVFVKSNEADRDGNWAIGGFVTAGVLGAATALTYVLWPTVKKRAQASALVVAPLGERNAHGLQLRMAF